MIVNAQNLQGLFTAFKTLFNSAFEGAKSQWREVAMEAPSSAREENYVWLGEFSRLREWIGQRVVKNLATHSYTIKNRTFEDTVSVSRDDISDDRIGVFNPVVSEMGRNAAVHPDELVFSVLKNGFATTCYDGQNFFDTDHPVIDENDQEQSVSNMQAGSSTPWYLLDCSRAVKPLIWQEREPYVFEMMIDMTNPYVFMNNEFMYGVRARGDAGFGLWQMAFGSKDDLTAENYEAARSAMSSLKGDNGRPLGLMGTHLVVPPSLEGKARKLIVNTVTEGGGSNEWAGSAQLIVSPWLA